MPLPMKSAPLVALLVAASPAAAAAASAAIHVVVDPSAVTHTISWEHGCHTDLGYSHEERGIFSQLLHGESFENISLPQLPGPDAPTVVVANDVDACGATSPTCFGAGDELTKLANVTTNAGCCAACAAYYGCNVWTIRDGEESEDRGFVGCHLRASWTHSSPSPGPCATGVLSGPLPSPGPPPAGAPSTTMWISRTSGTATSGLTSLAPLNGFQAAVLTVASDGSSAALINRGFWEQGLALQQGREYEGYVFVRAAKEVTMEVALEIGTLKAPKPTVLASSRQQAPGTGEWTRLNFSLTPSAATDCWGYEWGAAPTYCEPDLANRTGNSCLRCGGQFVISLLTPGTVHLDMAFLQEGSSWGTISPTIPAKRETVAWMQQMGVQSIRTGGTYVKIDKNENGTGDGYLWKQMRGPRWLRPPVLQQGGGEPKQYAGYLRSRGWGPFEAMALCEHLNVTSITTIQHDETPSDLADLVEYMFGSPSTTAWGAQRAGDGHPKAYPTDQYFEIGNEIDTPDFAKKALAMEAAAKQHGVGGKLKYACPWQCLGSLDTIVSQGAKALGSQVVFDLHTNTPGPAGEFGQWTARLAEPLAKLDKSELTDARVGWWETNTAKLHDMSRAIMEALDTADLDRKASSYRLDTRTASFCTQISGHDDLFIGGHGDQGLIFFGPNQTWAQPPAYVHQMMSEAQPGPHPLALRSNVSGGGGGALDVVAAGNKEGTQVTVRVVNPSSVTVESSLQLLGGTWQGAAKATLTTLAPPNGDPTAANGLTTPTAVSPHSRPLPWAGGSASSPVSWPAMSVSVVVIKRG